MRAAIYGEIIGAIREKAGVIVFSVKAEIPGEDDISTIVWAEEKLAKYLQEENLCVGQKIMVMGNMAEEDGYPYLKAEHVAIDFYSDWVKMNGE